MNKMNLEQAVGILKQVVDLGVTKGGLFANAKEVVIVNMAMEVVDKHCTPINDGSKDANESVDNGPGPQTKELKKGK